jgi:DNA topoisomerase VI subunit A
LLKNDPFIKHHKPWQDAIAQMLKMGVRIEQQAFAKHGLNYILEDYLPEKLKKKTFLP